MDASLGSQDAGFELSAPGELTRHGEYRNVTVLTFSHVDWGHVAWDKPIHSGFTPSWSDFWRREKE